MSIDFLEPLLTESQLTSVRAVKQNAESLLDHSPRFKFFTLHGKEHLESLFRIYEILLHGGIELTQREMFLLSMAICTHDLGMVVSLKDHEFGEISDGLPGFMDPVRFENFVREVHHDLIVEYVNQHFGFLTDLGLSAPDIALIIEIGKAHRKIDLRTLSGTEKRLGCLMRVIDELDIGPERAPIQVFQNLADEMDPISCFHWYKHSITSDWSYNHNVAKIEKNGRKIIQFEIEVRPPGNESIQYWLTQNHRPIRKTLQDEGAGEIIKDEFGVEIQIRRSEELSRASNLKGFHLELEKKALSQGRPVVLVVDDEARKYDDLFYPLMDEFYVVRAPNAKAAFQTLNATVVTLIIVDIQVSSGGIWTAAETSDFKLTGIKIVEEVRAKYPKVKIGVLTGTKHSLETLDKKTLDFFLKKPVDPSELLTEVQNAIA